MGAEESGQEGEEELMQTNQDSLEQLMAELETEDLDFFLMANLSPKRTGLPFVVWISPKGGARHDARIKIARSPKAHPSEFVSVAIRPEVRAIGGGISPQDLALIKRWVQLNYDVLIRYWDGDIEYTEDALALLKPIR